MVTGEVNVIMYVSYCENCLQEAVCLINHSIAASLHYQLGKIIIALVIGEKRRKEGKEGGWEEK